MPAGETAAAAAVAAAGAETSAAATATVAATVAPRIAPPATTDNHRGRRRRLRLLPSHSQAIEPEAPPAVVRAVLLRATLPAPLQAARVVRAVREVTATAAVAARVAARTQAREAMLSPVAAKTRIEVATRTIPAADPGLPFVRPPKSLVRSQSLRQRPSSSCSSDCSSPQKQAWPVALAALSRRPRRASPLRPARLQRQANRPRRS